MGERMRQGLTNLHSPLIKEIRGKGLMNAIVISDQVKVFDLCLILAEHYGVLSKPTHETIIRLTPPLCIVPSEVDAVVSAIGKALNIIQLPQ